MSLITVLSLAALSFTGCVAEKTTTQGGTLAPPNAKFLNAAELKRLLTGKTTPWKDLRSGKEGKKGVNFYNPNGTYSGLGTWRVTEDGSKCNTKMGKERCAKVYKKEGKYIGVKKNGNDNFEFTAKNTNNGQLVSIIPISGKYLSAAEVKQLYSCNTTLWKYFNNGKEGETSYNADGTYSAIHGTWRITEDGLKCQTNKRKKKEYCGKVYEEGSNYYVTNKSGNKAKFSFTVK